jgi:cytochrome c oxidase cbb3-type subunit 3/ubiquinol-cytochrome c reductase cytochrome c subunit
MSPTFPLGPALALAATLAAACGGARSDSPPPHKDGGVTATPSQPTADPQVAQGAALYGKYCALCHGPAAAGYAADNAPSLVTRTFLESADDSFFAKSIELGRPGTAMAGYGRDLGGPLSDAEISAVMAFLRDLGGVRTPVATPAPMAGDPARGQPIYEANCQHCHGNPTTRGAAVHLANPMFLKLATDGFLRYAIVFGRPGTQMLPFASMIDGNQVADVVAYVRSWASPPPPKPEVPPTAPDGPVVINAGGKAPTFKLREGRFVAAAEVAAALAANKRMVIIDARPPSDWLRERIPGAISVPHYDTSSLDRVPRDVVVVAYCACPHHASGAVVDELLRRGHTRAYVLDEGILVWRKAGYPIAGESASN